MPLQASATSHLPPGMVMMRPSRRAGTFVRSRSFIANHAEKSCNQGISQSPMGTAKNRKTNGIPSTRAAGVPISPQIKMTIIATRKKC